MKYVYSFLAIIFIALLSGCQEEGTMVLLDKNISKIEVAESKGTGQVNEELLMTFTDRPSIRIFEQAITSAVKKDVAIPDRIPDFDILVGYEGDGLPTHAIHIWLGEENEESILTYMVGDGQPYVTSGKRTNELRELLIPLKE